MTLIVMGKLELVLLKSVEDEEKVKKWYSEVMEEVKRQIKKIDDCIICCLQEKIELVLSQLKEICSAYDSSKLNLVSGNLFTKSWSFLDKTYSHFVHSNTFSILISNVFISDS
jgi:hypothetical protein